MKTLIVTFVCFLSFELSAYSQAKEEKGSITLTSDRYTQQINKDSLNNGETSFRYINTMSLNGTIESQNKNNKQEKSSTFISTALVITPTKDNKE